MANGPLEGVVEAGPGARGPADMGGDIASVLAGFGRRPSYVIPALQAVQERLGWLPAETFGAVGAHFNMPESRVYGVATFYAQF